MNAIEIKNISKKYEKFHLKSVNLSLPRGTIMGLVGENGAGKTTTLQLILDMISSDEGKVEVLGVNNQAREFKKLKEKIGVVLDAANFPETMTGKEISNIMKHAYAQWEEKLFQTYIKNFHIDLKKKFKEYSRGMKMKLSIAIALSHHSELLIFDEATSGLDPVAREEILDILNEFTRDENHSVLLSSHIVSDLEKVCDYIAFMKEGELIFVEEKDQLLDSYGLLRCEKEQMHQISSNAIISKKTLSYGYELLVKRGEIPRGLELEHTSLEDIILGFSRRRELC